MKYRALATDYDGTIAEDGQVSQATREALHRLRESGRKLVLVTGREVPDLLRVFDGVDLFDRVVAENGALLFRPETREEMPLAPPASNELVQALRQRGVEQLSVGRSIVATWRPQEIEVLHAIRELGLELVVIFNKDAVMVLPTGVNKATGLRVALRELRIAERDVVGVGDAENDHSFLELCGLSVAVDNAIPALKKRVSWVTQGARGTGVQELIGTWLDDELGRFAQSAGGAGAALEAAASTRLA